MSVFAEYKELLKKGDEPLLRIKVITSSGRSEIVGVTEDGTVKIALKSVPEKGKANQELIRLLGKEFEVGKSGVRIISGHTSRLKLVRLCG